LSRSDKRILHVDRNEYYGGAEAALSLQDADSWVKSGSTEDGFSHAVVVKPTTESTSPSDSDSVVPKLGFSRAYSLALAPQLIYTQSKLLPLLVSSKVYRQLEFLAMGSWWVYTTDNTSNHDDESSEKGTGHGHFTRIPTTREDVVFSDKSIDLRSKRAVMKVLRFIMDYEDQPEICESYNSRPLPEFLTEHFKLSPTLHNLFLALTLSPNPPQSTTTSFALPRIARHLRSTGKLGAGFSSVIPKWGGLSEIAQVACRAGAVGGAVYVLGMGIEEVTSAPQPESSDTQEQSSTQEPVVPSVPAAVKKNLKLDGGEIVSTTRTVGTLPSDSESSGTGSRLVSIISSPLLSLFPKLSEGAPVPVGAVVVFPSGSITLDSMTPTDTPPVYLIIHSSDTGECPVGQCKFTHPLYFISFFYTNFA
jgi:RAB protein geranylgeranyltransferase component A